MRAVVYSALAAYWAGALVWSRRLPARYPIHFQMNGEPDRWTSGSAEWFLLPAIATVTVMLMIGVGALARSRPQYWNIPEKKRFLALTTEHRAPIIAVLTRMLDVVSLYVIALFAVCQWVIYLSASSGMMRMALLFHVVLWGGIVWLVSYALWMNRRVKKMILAAEPGPDVRT